MKFISSAGLIAKARRFLNGSASVDDSDLKDPERLAKVMRGMSLRLSELESRVGPEPIEFEVNVGSGGAVTNIQHNFGSYVRWWVTAWTQQSNVTYPVVAPILVQDASSDANVLALRSYATGRAIVRVEPAFAGVDPGITVVPVPPAVVPPTEYTLALAANFTTTSLVAANSNLTFPIAANEVWRIFFQGTCGDTDAGGMKFAIGAPAGASVDAMHYSSTVNSTTRAYNAISSVNTLGNAVHTVAGGQRDDQIVGVVKNGGTAGNVTIQAATITVASTAQINAKASLFAKKVTEV